MHKWGRYIKSLSWTHDNCDWLACLCLMLACSLAATARWLLQKLKLDDCQFPTSALRHAVCTLLEYIMCMTNHNVKHSCEYLKHISSSKETVNGKFTFPVDSIA